VGERLSKGRALEDASSCWEKLFFFIKIKIDFTKPSTKADLLDGSLRGPA